ncbi:MAG: hypothetical protein JNK46_20690 [Methylobacteriaceae bacterium]|nr:hypothetical protein [Methylobacteriaceae bacterium]
MTIAGWARSLAMVLAFACAGVAARAQDAKGVVTDPAILEKNRKENAECYGCHSEAGYKNPPRADMDMVKLRALLHDPAKFDGSNHVGMNCKICHGQPYETYPHPAGLKQNLSPCSECHATKSLRVEKQFEDSVHAKNLKDAFTCQTCHDPHVYKVAQKIGDPRVIVAQDNQMCIDCHNSDLRYSKFSAQLSTQKVRPDLDTLHKWLPNARLHWQAARCIDCHTPVSKVKSLQTSHEILAKDKAEKNCVACHSQQSQLAARLYRYAATNAAADLGFTNPSYLGSAYVIGATRNPWLDWGIIGAFAATILGLFVHGAIRVVAAGLRGRRAS